MLGGQYLGRELADSECQMAAGQPFGTFHTMPVVQVVIAGIGLELFVGQGQIPFLVRVGGGIELEQGVGVDDAAHAQSLSLFISGNRPKQVELALPVRLADVLEQEAGLFI